MASAPEWFALGGGIGTIVGNLVAFGGVWLNGRRSDRLEERKYQREVRDKIIVEMAAYAQERETELDRLTVKTPIWGLPERLDYHPPNELTAKVRLYLTATSDTLFFLWNSLLAAEQMIAKSIAEQGQDRPRLKDDDLAVLAGRVAVRGVMAGTRAALAADSKALTGLAPFFEHVTQLVYHAFTGSPSQATIAEMQRIYRHPRKPGANFRDFEITDAHRTYVTGTTDVG